jgi:hypothetical protein
MKRASKVCLGMATLWPVAYVILFLATVGYGALGGPTALEAFPFELLLVLHLLTMLLGASLLVFYVSHLFRNDRVDKDKRSLWAIVLLLGSIVAMPIYWYAYVWTQDPASAPDSPG